MKRFLSLMTFAIMSIMAAFAYDVEIDGIYYNLVPKAKQATVVSKVEHIDTYNKDNQDAYSGDVIIPEKFIYDGIEYTVKSIGYGAFFYCTGVTSVVIPESVENIETHAFAYCTSMKYLTLPGKYYNQYVLGINYDCNALEMINFTFTDELDMFNFLSQKVKQYMSRDYVKRSLILEGKIVENIVLPETITSIGQYAFRQMSLNSLTLPASLLNIEGNAFEGCSISKLCVNDFTSFFNLNLEGYNNPLNTGAKLYINGKLTTNLTIPESIDSIRPYTFYGANIDSVSIPYNIKVGDNAFANSKIKNILFSNECIYTLGNNAFLNCSELTKVVLPNNIRDFGTNVFNGCRKLCIINIPANLTTIPLSTFAGCSSIISITIPTSIKTINKYAFSGCTCLPSITIPSSVKLIGDGTFAGCTGLKEIFLYTSEGLPEIQGCCFANCRNLETVTLKAEDIITNFSSTATDAFDGSYIEYATLNVPKNSINNLTGTVWANFGTINSTQSDMANDTCGDNATWKLQDTGELTISGTGSMYNYTSTNSAPWNEYLSSIKQVVIEDGITHVGDYAFASCSELDTISIPKSVTSIGEGFINGCSKLTKIGVDDDNDNYISVDNVLFSKDKTELIACLGGRDKALVIPATVSAIDANAFNSCSKLTGIKCKVSTPIVLSSDIFADVDKASCTLYVPFKADKALYEVADYWKEFSNIETMALELNDEETTFKAEVFEPGYATYTRTGSAIAEDKYASFCLPFDIDLSQADCFKKVYTPIDAVLYNTNTSNLCLMFKTNALDSTIPAGTPFIGLLNGNDVLVQNKVSVTYTGAETNPDMKELTVFNYSGDGALWEKEDMTVSYGGTYAKTEVTADGVYSFSSTGNFGDKAIGTFLSPFRAYINVTASSAKVKDVELWLDDNKATDMENIIANNHSNSKVDVYNMNGMKVRSNVPAGLATQGLLRGLYIVNGQKVLIK